MNFWPDYSKLMLLLYPESQPTVAVSLTWHLLPGQVIAGQLYLTVITFPVFLFFLGSLPLSSQSESFKSQLKCYLLCEVLFDTPLPKENQFLPTQNSHNNLLILLFLPLMPSHTPQLEDRDDPLLYFSIPKNLEKGRRGWRRTWGKKG